MTSPVGETFPHPKPSSWEEFIEEGDGLAELDTNQKRAVRQAVEVLRKELGEGFLVRAWQTGHPFLELIINRVGWTRLLLVWIAEAMQKLSSSPGYCGLVEQLRQPKAYPEGMQVLQAAWRFCAHGGSVEFEPEVSVSGKMKRPDVRISMLGTDETLYLEVTSQKASASQVRVRDTSRTLFIELIRHAHPGLYAGRVYKMLSPAHLEEVANEIRGIVREFNRRPDFLVLEREGVVDVALAPPNRLAQLKAWADLRGLRPGEFDGPPDDTNEIQRLRHKIRNKLEQLPSCHPGVVVVHTSILPSSEPDVRSLMNVLEEDVFSHDQLLAAVLVGGFMGEMASVSHEQGLHVFIQHTGIPPLIEQHLILFNRYSKHACASKVISLVRKAYAIRSVPSIM